MGTLGTIFSLRCGALICRMSQRRAGLSVVFSAESGIIFLFTEADGKLSLYFETSEKMRLKSPAP